MPFKNTKKSTAPRRIQRGNARGCSQQFVMSMELTHPPAGIIGLLVLLFPFSVHGTLGTVVSTRVHTATMHHEMLPLSTYPSAFVAVYVRCGRVGKTEMCWRLEPKWRRS